mmetsp:Transcript_18939/g.32354  ORF Transcript_18939/g.32354 Transcript_18939/m.32354 type:complete len:100 (-) Transcript_18939:325-624(-)
MTAEEVNDQMKFVRKVYSILMVQLIITFFFVLAVQTLDPVKDFIEDNPSVGLACAVLSIVTAIAIICCFGRKVPMNYFLLGVFTICETYMVGSLTSIYD